jgi:hypothetical protein
MSPPLKQIGWLQLMKGGLSFYFLSFFLTGTVLAAPKEECFYSDAAGNIRTVRSRDQIPPDALMSAKCFSPKKAEEATRSWMASPEEITLEGNARKVDMASSLGPVQLRWVRKAERLFGRTPERAVAEAMSTTSRALFAGRFPSQVRENLKDWKIVFMDEDVPEEQIPMALITNCHPAWMTPPSNIYLVSQRIVAGCGGQQTINAATADVELTKVLLHEIGHVVEYRLLEEMQSGDRARAEGFATWFAAYAADHSALIGGGKVRKRDLEVARNALSQGLVTQYFQGTEYDYMAASLPFHAIQKVRGVTAIFSVYEQIAMNRLPFPVAIEEALGWDERRVTSEIEKLLKKTG